MTPEAPHPDASPADLPQLVEHLFRHHSGRLVASLTRAFGAEHLDLVEDVVQEALLRALRTWPFDAVPDDPLAWLHRVARNLAVDALRRGRIERRAVRNFGERVPECPAAPDAHFAAVELGDDCLRLMFLCCHPSLPPESQVALTLKSLCGFGVREIARALLAKEATVAQRLSRAKERLRQAGATFDLPAGDGVTARLRPVLDVLYLLFNEGYLAHAGSELVRRDLVEEAVRLTGILVEHPATRRPEVHALLALMLLLGARLPARIGDLGALTPAADQDRSAWDREWLRCGFVHFERSIAGATETPFHVEAAIAATHVRAPSDAQTDWPTILRLYDRLLGLRDTPIVRLNRAVAIAKVHGPGPALLAVRAIEQARELRSYHLLPATRGWLHCLAGDPAAAAAAFEEALRRDCSEPERRLLEERLTACRRQSSNIST